MKQILVEVGYVNGYYSAHLPQLPGCITTGSSLREIETYIMEIVPFHLEGQKESGGEIPEVLNGEYHLVLKFPIVNCKLII